MAKKTIIQDPQDRKFQEWMFYDGQCTMCANLAHRMKNLLNTRNIGLAPIQIEWVQKRIADVENPLKEMLFETSNHNILRGADALIYLARKIWWAYGFYLFAQIPGIKYLFRRIYGFIARHRYCVSGSCRITYD